MTKVLITGANKGIGYGIAKFLGKSGWQVIVGARDEQRAQKAIEQLKAEGADVIGWQYINLSDNSSLEKSVEEIKKNYPDLKMLVNNAGIPGDMTVASYDNELNDVLETVQVNYVGTFVLTNSLFLCLQKMKDA